MTIVRQLLTNGAYGFGVNKIRRVQPVAIACVHVTGNSKTAAYTDLHAAAQAERNYANRVSSDGPSAHLYIARDGWGIEAVDATKYASWSNGDVSSPNTANPGIKRVLALRAKGYNANEAYWEEYESVGFGSNYPITDAQMRTMAERIAARSASSGLPIDRETVHGHWEINGIDRQNCPNPNHEAFLDKLIDMAKGADVTIPISTTTAPGVYDVDLTVGDQLYDQSFAPLVQVSLAQTADGYFVTGTGFIAIEVVTGGQKQLAFVKGTAVTIRLKPVPAPTVLEAVPVKYPVSVGGKAVGEVELP